MNPDHHLHPALQRHNRRCTERNLEANLDDLIQCIDRTSQDLPIDQLETQILEVKFAARRAIGCLRYLESTKNID